MLADWYSPSHIVHGFLFYAGAVAGARTLAGRAALPAALAIEAAWEIIENTPLIIDRYREATARSAIPGDSVINSLSDVAMMALGFLAAGALPLWANRRCRAGARAGAAARHPRQSDAQRLDAAGAQRRDPRVASGLI